MKASLKVVEGPLIGREFAFEGHDSFVFGRDKRCSVNIADDPCISSCHFILEFNSSEVWLRDLNSLNGTWVNGKRIGEKDSENSAEPTDASFSVINIKNGDRIQAGQTVFSVAIQKNPADVTTLVCDGKNNPVSKNYTNVLPPSLAQYDVIRKIGEGGMGSVYLARSKENGSFVALKSVASRVVMNDTIRRLFFRELEVIKPLNHPHIVRYLAEGAGNDVFWFVMEYCNGGDVSRLVSQKGGSLTPQLALQIMRHVLDGMAYAHGRNLVHRDIKPQNILIQKNENGIYAKVCDFGLAKSFDNAGMSGMTLTGDFCGTLDYSPREQLTNYKYVRPVSDVWSLGASLYFMLSGVPPRGIPSHGQARNQALLRVLRSPVTPIREQMPNLSSTLSSVIDTALAENPADRFFTALEFNEALSKAYIYDK